MSPGPTRAQCKVFTFTLWAVGKGTEDRVETEGEELSAEWVALPRAARRHNDLRRQAIASHIELRRSSIPCDGPSPESREARCND